MQNPTNSPQATARVSKLWRASKATNNLLMLATAGLHHNQINDRAHQYSPRVDYIELQKRFGAELIDYSAYNNNRLGNIFRHLETQVHSDLYLAMLGLVAQRRSRVVFAWSERVGIPFAQLRRFLPNPRPFVSMFTCWSPLQEATMTKLNLFSSMDAIVLHCNSMRDHMVGLGVAPEKLHVIRYSRDEKFFDIQPEVEQRPGFVLSLGESRSRDYKTLFQAVDGLPLDMLVAASGHWYAREKRRNVNFELPSNVTVTERLPIAHLRRLYAQSQFVILPVYDSIYSAGATSSLEAMAMGRPVIATRSRGIQDYVIDGETGILVEPGDDKAMRAAICDLLSNPEKAKRMGRNARERVEQHLNLNNYVEQLGNLLETFI